MANYRLRQQHSWQSQAAEFGEDGKKNPLHNIPIINRTETAFLINHFHMLY